MKRFMVICLMGCTSLQMQAQGVTALAGVQEQGKTAGLITIDLDNVQMADAIREIAQRSGRKITFAPTLIPSRRVTYRGTDVTVAVALNTVLQGTNIRVENVQNGSLVLVQGDGRKQAGQGIITGRVTDAKTGKGVSGATVSLDADSRGGVSDENGSYHLNGVISGSHIVVVRSVGYAKQTRRITVGEVTSVIADFKLEPSASVLDQVIVTGTVVSTELKAVPNAITVITAKQIEERGVTRIDQLFRGEVPGLFALNTGATSPLDSAIVFSRGATKFQPIFVGDAATNTIKTFVDGVELANSAYLSQLDPRSIERIEILSGPQASTIYGSNALNGVMQIFTKRGASAKPRIQSSIMSGIVQNNFSSSLAPQHDYSTQISGSESRVSYNAGGSWYYIAPWSPAKQTGRISGFGGVRFQGSEIAVDVTGRRGNTKNTQNGSADQVRTVFNEDGSFTPDGLSGRTSAMRYTLNGQTFGIAFNYSPSLWWSHELVLGKDEANVGRLGTTPSYRSPGFRRVVLPSGTVIQQSFPGDTLLSLSQSQSSRWSSRYVSTSKVAITPNVGAILTLGGDGWQITDIQTSFSGGVPALTGALFGTPTVTRQTSHNAGGFFQSQISIFDQLFLTYGIRSEWNPNFGEESNPNFAPRYGIAYTHNYGPVTAKLRASYGRSTRPPEKDLKRSLPTTVPTVIAQYGPHDVQLGNPDLAPEFQQGGEGGIELYLGNRGSLVVTRYNQTVDGLIVRVFPVDSIRSLEQNPTLDPCTVQPDGYCYGKLSQYLNIGSVRNQGWELQGSINTGPFTTRGTYSWTKSRVIGITPRYRSILAGTQYQVGYTFNLLPEHTWSTSLTYTRGGTNMSLNVSGITQMFSLGDGLSYTVSNRLLVDRQIFTIPPGYQAVADGYAIANISAVHRFTRDLEGILQVDNLSNFYRNDYDTFGAALGRQTRIGMRINL